MFFMVVNYICIVIRMSDIKKKNHYNERDYSW